MRRSYWSDLKLRTQISLLVGLSIGTIVLAGLFSYDYSLRLSTQRAKVYEENILRQVEDRIDSISNDMRNLAQVVGYSEPVQDYLIATDPLERLDLFRKTRASLLSYQSAIRDTYAILLLDNESRLTDSVQLNYTLDVPGFIAWAQEKYGNQDRSFSKPVFTTILDIPTAKVDYYAYLAPINSTVDYTPIDLRLGSILVLCSTAQMQKTVESIVTGPNSFFLILDAEDTVVGHNNPAVLKPYLDAREDGKPLPIRQSLLDRYSGRPRYILHEQKVDGVGWTILSVVDTRDLDKEMVPFQMTAMVLVVAAVLLLGLIGYMLQRSISRPMDRIVAFLNAFPSANYKERMQPGAGNEMGQIVEHFNRLMDKMDEVNRSMMATQARLYESEIEGRKSQFAALQSQINPHFLYNTLDCVRSIALVSGLRPIVDIAVAMSAIFRYSVKADGDATIRDEAAIVHHYIRIIRIRHQDRISFEVDLSEDLMECVAPRMILQPVVENAVYHGLEPKEGPGRVWISGTVENGFVILTVRDDGTGLDGKTADRIRQRLEGEGLSEEEDEIRKTTGIGLLNIHRRLRFRYGNPAGLTFSAAPGEGTSVRIVFPLVRRTK